MIFKKLVKKIRRKWHGDLWNSQEEMFSKLSDILEQKRNELQGGISWVNLELIRFRDGIIRTTPRRTIKLCFDIIERCNLNCTGCLTYAPLASKMYSIHRGGC